MEIQCPKCGKPVVVKGLGRKPFNIPLKNVYDALQVCGGVIPAAEKLGVSSAYIYKVCGDRGLKPIEIITGKRLKGNVL